MREQKLRANWLNTENARCHRTVYITTQNVTSKLQIGLSLEMGWYPVSFTVIVNKDVWVCTPGRCSWALFKDCPRPLRFSLHSWYLKSFRFWRLSIRYRSCFFHSCIFQPCYLLLHFPLLHFPLPHFQRSPRSYVAIHASDGQTDGWTDRQADRQTDRRIELRQQYRALHYMQSHGKKPNRVNLMAVSICRCLNSG